MKIIYLLAVQNYDMKSVTNKQWIHKKEEEKTYSLHGTLPEEKGLKYSLSLRNKSKKGEGSYFKMWA